MTGGGRGVVLLVDDDPGTIDLLDGVLSEHYDLVFALDGAQAVEMAHTAVPDLILLDVMMPGIDGVETCRRLKADPRTASIPVLFLSALGDADTERRGLEAGASDYVTKPITPEVLRLRLRIQFELLDGRRALERQLRTDGLTGLVSRGEFDDQLARHGRRTAHRAAPLSLILCDVDGFRAFNEQWGHQVGDEALRAVAAVVRRSGGRRQDVVARFGSDELAILLPETAACDAVRAAERVREGVAALALPRGPSAERVGLTVSVGVATVLGTMPDLGVLLVARATQHLHLAKQLGRNRVVADTVRMPTVP
jgi:diguanylate cyclase (GGDEF)-like protein